MKEHEASVLALSIFTVLLCLGCGQVQIYSDFDQPRSELSGYRALEIADFESDIASVPEDALVKIPDEVQKRLSLKRGVFKQVSREVVDNVPPDETLILFGLITDYQPGTSVKAEGGTIKFGESTLVVSLSLVEEATGVEISRGTVSGFNSFGFLRSGLFTKGVYESLAEEIVNFITENY